MISRGAILEEPRRRGPSQMAAVREMLASLKPDIGKGPRLPLCLSGAGWLGGHRHGVARMTESGFPIGQQVRLPGHSGEPVVLEAEGPPGAQVTHPQCHNPPGGGRCHGSTRGSVLVRTAISLPDQAQPLLQAKVLLRSLNQLYLPVSRW